MKRLTLILCVILVLSVLSGCESGRGEPGHVGSDPMGETISGDPYAVDVGYYYGDFPGGIQPAVRVGDKNYYFSGASQVLYGTDTPEGEVYSIGNGDTYLPEGYTPVGEISSVTDGPLTEELQFRVGCNASGTVYTSAETPEVVYVHLLADWFSVQEPMYFRFISEEMKDNWILYGGNRYLISIGTGECEALEELPAGCEKMGTLTYIGIDRIPENDLETNCPNDSYSKALMGRDVYFDPNNPEFLYVYEHHYWAEGDYPTYLACPMMEARSVEPSQSAANIPEDIPADVIDRLKAYPDGYRETCKCTDLVIMDQGGAVINENLWNDFYGKVQNGESAEIVVAYFTVEGDPILNYVRYDGASYYHVYDNSRDMYGAEPHYTSKTFTYLQSFVDLRTEMFVLSNAPLEDLDAYEEYCQTQPEPYPVTLLRIIKHSGELHLEDICGDSEISPEEIETALAAASGMEWEEYKKLLSAAIESDDYSNVAVSLDGRMGYYVIHYSPDGSRVRAIRFHLLDDDPDAEGWLFYTETIHGILSDTCTEKQPSTNYMFNGGKIHLEHGPVNSEDYTIHADGTASYAGVVGVLGDRILEFHFTFEN